MYSDIRSDLHLATDQADREFPILHQGVLNETANRHRLEFHI